MATPAQVAARRTAVMKRYQELGRQGKSADTMSQAQQRNLMAAQGGISNIKPGDVSFGTRSQTGQGSPYNMYPTGSYNTQVARYWDSTKTGNAPVDNTSGGIIGQFAQYERAIEPEASDYIDTAARLQKENERRLTGSRDQYVQGNARMQEQSDAYYKGLGAYNQAEQSAQQAFAANEARRATGSQQAATAAGQRVGAQYVGQSLQAQQQKYAEDKALLNELTNYINDYNAKLKEGADQYDLGTRNKLLDMKAQLATNITNQQIALLGQNLGADLNEQAAQRAFIRQQALNQQAADLNKGASSSASSGSSNGSSSSTSTTSTSPLQYIGIRSNVDGSTLAQGSDGKQYTLTAQQANTLRSTGKLR